MLIHQTKINFQLETVSMSEPLQNRHHVQTPYLDQIWHATVGQWSTLTGLISSGSVYCVANEEKKLPKCRNFDPVFTFLEALVSICLYKPGPNLAANSTSLPTVYANTPNFIWIRCLCHLPGTKMQFTANFDIWGLLYPAPLSIRTKFCVLEQTTVYACVPDFVSIGLFYRPLAAKPPNFATFWFNIFWCRQLAEQSEKVEHGCSTRPTNLLLSNGIKTVSVLQHTRARDKTNQNS